jgi:hypothetical protein
MMRATQEIAGYSGRWIATTFMVRSVRSVTECLKCHPSVLRFNPAAV